MKLLMSVLLLGQAGPDDLDFSKAIGRVGPENILSEEGWFVWGGSAIRGEDGKVYLFYSRWRKGMEGREKGEKLFNGFMGWVKYSEIACAVSDKPEGPFRPLGAILKGSGDPERWDLYNGHNPHVVRFGDRVYLYYIGNRPVKEKDPWRSYTNGQCIGVATAASVAELAAGKYERSAEPLVMPDGKRTFQRTVNPGVTRGHDGRYYMMFKARSAPLRAKGDHMTHWIAVADAPAGPFELLGPALVGADIAAEDPFFWYDAPRKRYYAIVKNFSRTGKVLAPQFGALALITSEKGVGDWKPAKHSLVSLKEYRDAKGTRIGLQNLERPQLLFDASGRPECLYAAAAERRNRNSFNLHLKLTWPAAQEK